MCKHLLAQGDKVVATLRKPADLDALAAQHSPSALLVLPLDVTRPEEIARAFAAAHTHFGRIDAVFNNAACAVVGEVEAVPEADARAVMDVNFWGAAAVSTAAVRFFRETNPPGAGGVLLNVSSEFGHSAFACVGYYCAAKFGERGLRFFFHARAQYVAALEGLTEALAQELDPEWNIKVRTSPYIPHVPNAYACCRYASSSRAHFAQRSGRRRRRCPSHRHTRP